MKNLKEEPLVVNQMGIVRNWVQPTVVEQPVRQEVHSLLANINE